MPGHTRLYRRGAVYYHRAAVPQDIRDTYGKVEETFSLKTRDRAEAVRRVGVAAVEVDRRFEEHRRFREAPPLAELSADQLAHIRTAYLHHLLDEDEETRLDGFYDPDEVEAPEHPEPRPTFEEFAEGVSEADGVARYLSFWLWAASHYDDVPPNPVAGLSVKGPVKAKDQRHPFSLDQLRKIFSGPLFVGCRSERLRAQPGQGAPYVIPQLPPQL